MEKQNQRVGSAPQSMRPSGIAGRIFAALMERMNESAFQWAASHLPAKKDLRVLELGFGTGRFLELAVQSREVSALRGVDPSELMFKMAQRRLKRYAKRVNTDLRLGSDTDDFWPAERFDTVAAIHSFQFWERPDKTISRIRTQIKSDGVLLIVLRQHGRIPPNWLPNPISRSSAEVDGASKLLISCGFEVSPPSRIGRASIGLFARPTPTPPPSPP